MTETSETSWHVVEAMARRVCTEFAWTDQKYSETPRTQSSNQPTKEDVVFLKESSLQGTWKLIVLEILILLSTDGKIKTATVRAASGKLINRVLNFLFPLQNPKLAKMKSNDSENVPKREPKRAANGYIIFLKQEYRKLMRENPPKNWKKSMSCLQESGSPSRSSSRKLINGNVQKLKR